MGPTRPRDDNPSREARERASRIADDLVREQPTGDGELALADVEEDTEQFNRQVELLEYLDLGVPAMASDVHADVVPLSVHLVAPGAVAPSGPRRPPANPQVVRDRVEDSFHAVGRSVPGFRVLPPPVARDLFRDRLRDFLAVRIDSLLDGPRRAGSVLRLPLHRGHHPSPVPGCTFVVTTDSVGLRVFWSGAYFVTANYFGAPTSPAAGTLQAGAYLFGVDGGAYRSITWDVDAVVTLPGTPSVHLNF